MPFQRLTLAELRQQLEDRWDSSPYWSTADADQAINEALLLWNALTGYWRERITITIPANDPYAAIPGTMVQGAAVTIGHNPLVPGSLLGLSMARPNWRRETTLSTGCPSVPTIWAPMALNAFVIWPAATTDSQASIDGVRRTPRLVAEGDFLDADDTVVNALLGYALHAAAFKAPASLMQRTAGYLEDFLKQAVDRNAALKSTEWYKRIQRASRQQKLLPVKVVADDDTGGPGGL